MKAGLAACALGLVVSIASAAQAASKGSVYCKAGKPALQFAGRVEPDGSLFFGLSVWDDHGDNSFAHGTAARRGDHWLYVAAKPEHDPQSPPCRLEIWYSPRDGVRAKAALKTDCSNHGRWREVRLPPKSYQGQVTVELDDPGNFFEDPPGLLGKGDCFKQNQDRP